MTSRSPARPAGRLADPGAGRDRGARGPAAGPYALIAIRDGGLATSSTAARRWQRGGDVLHHILDPRTGLPAEPVWRTVSVAAGSCADANAASTAAVIRGHRAPGWLAQLGLPARLVDTTGAVFTVAGWPDESRQQPHEVTIRQLAQTAVRSNTEVTSRLRIWRSPRIDDVNAEQNDETRTAAMSSTAFWYASRATGIVALLLLTAVLVLGILVNRQGRLPGLPRFAVTDIHRNLSLLSVAFIAVHVLTAVLDTFVSIPLAAGIIPFASGYERLWLGLGAISLDLMLAMIVTSLLRGRLNRVLWRAIHLLAYLSWPIAFAHSIGSSKDLQQGWMLDMAVGCALIVAAAVIWRLAHAARQVPRAGRVAAVFAQHTAHAARTARRNRRSRANGVAMTTAP